MVEADDAPAGRGWTFLTHHAHVLLVVRRHPLDRGHAVDDVLDALTDPRSET
jgi:hypothetical protein